MELDLGKNPSDRSEVTGVIRHVVKDGQQANYEQWLRTIVPIAANAAGHRGVNVIKPAAGSTEYTTVLHFDTIDNLRNWLDSDTRRKLVDDVLPFLAGEDEVDIKTGLEFWFTPPSRRPAARPYKQVLVTLSAIYPLTILIPLLLKPLFDATSLFASPYVRGFVVTAAIVALITYVIMPRYVRLIAKWLYK